MADNWKLGDEFLPFHHDASHVSADYRDGWNACYQAAPEPMTLSRVPGPLEGERYEPSNGTEGGCFIEEWCSNCARDKEMNGTCQAEGRDADDGDWCEILNASYRGEAVEWRELPDGTVKCIAFVAVGERIPAAKCPHTMDLPL